MRVKIDLLCVPARWLAVALLALAPLACVAFCKITHNVIRRHHAAMTHDAGDAPLSHMQELVHAVTDALPQLWAWAGALVLIAFHIKLRFFRIRLALVPPTPPPKRPVLPPFA